MKNRRSLSVWAVTATLLFLAADVFSYVWLQLRYQFAFERAMSAYRESRGPGAPPIDSDDFANWGIRCGFSEAQVDHLMQRAMKISGRLVDPHRHGFEKEYDFRYGSVWALGHQTVLIEERVWVLFDSSGKAIRINRDLFIHNDAQRTGMREFDLCAPDLKKGQTIEKGT